MALARLDALSETDRARVDVTVARARLAIRLDRDAEVVRELARWRERLPRELWPWAGEARARALLFLGRAEEASADLEALPELTDAGRALAAEALAMRGDRARAFALAGPLVERDPPNIDTFALRSMLAELVFDGGERDRAITLLRALLVDRPTHPDAPWTEATLARWLSTPTVAFTSEERTRRARRFIAAHEAARALAELEPLPRPAAGSPALGPWLAARGEALYEARRYPEAARVLAESARVNARPRHRFLAARATLRAGDEREAIAALERFVREAPTDASAPEAEWLVATTLLRSGRTREGRRRLELFLRGPRARRSAGLRRESEWALGMLELDARRGREAEERFRAWGARAESAMDRARALYWEGRAALVAADGARAERALRASIRAEPLGWYALWAAIRLREAGIDPGPPVALDPPAEASFEALVEPPLVTFLASLGFDADAATLLRADERGRSAPGSRRALVERFIALGDAERAYRLTGSSALLGFAPRGEAAWIWRAAYPRPFGADVERAAREAGVPAALIYAVMRQESAFDPRVVSRADAIGLLQLLPSTAARVGRRIGAPASRELLYRPEHNVRLGAAYLRALVDEVGVPLAFAAYNAGEHRVREWLERARRVGGARGQELDRFVEDIPFKETRNYIRRVTSSYARYLYAADVAGGADPSRYPTLPLPARVGGSGERRGAPARPEE